MEFEIYCYFMSQLLIANPIPEIKLIKEGSDPFSSSTKSFPVTGMRKGVLLGDELGVDLLPVDHPQVRLVGVLQGIILWGFSGVVICTPSTR